ncbi:hypothetical protein DRE_04042 [Drechslerella stenobrocha 248]|uniref:FAD-binding domain-containing protein n=1 Tax=Drechslerella stenobrocha 248 TaxID=1043628 RepID=W7I312_9PEZI|nr:hypothetical protein DRE_04042 [Drechslerella stenobrocha 248]
MAGQLKKVIIVGAGPAGLFLALRLAQKGISTTVFETASSASQQPRATHYGAPAVYELRRAGVLAEMEKDPDCFLLNKFCWRKLDGTYLAGIDGRDLNENGKTSEHRIVVCALNKVVKVLEGMVAKLGMTTIKYGHRVLPGAEQDGEKAWVNVQRVADGVVERHEADYIVGCDGASSQIRRSLFGDRVYPGYTWENQIVATNTLYDFSKFNWDDSNFIIHPEHSFMAAKISETQPLWRVTYTEVTGLSDAEILARQAWKFETMLPGHPKPGEYTVVQTSPYKIHQRCSPTFRVGRYLLAADAAHLCNPFGGLGLTGGIVDVGGLADCLVGLHEGKAGEAILDEYSRVRIEKFKTIIDPISTENFRRLYDQDPELVLEKDEFIKIVRAAEEDIEMSRKLQLGPLAILHDFTQSFEASKAARIAPTNSPEKVDTAAFTGPSLLASAVN